MKKNASSLSRPRQRLHEAQSTAGRLNADIPQKCKDLGSETSPIDICRVERLLQSIDKLQRALLKTVQASSPTQRMCRLWRVFEGQVEQLQTISMDQLDKPSGLRERVRRVLIESAELKVSVNQAVALEDSEGYIISAERGIRQLDAIRDARPPTKPQGKGGPTQAQREAAVAARVKSDCRILQEQFPSRAEAILSEVASMSAGVIRGNRNGGGSAGGSSLLIGSGSV